MPGRGATATRVGVAACLALLVCGALAAQRTTPPAATPTRKRAFTTRQEITPHMRRVVDRALAYLASRANADGSFGDANAQIAITALTTLSFMASGSTANRGPYQKEVSRAVKFLMNHVSTDPNHRGYIVMHEDPDSRMHGHGFATLALAEALGTYGNGNPEKFKALKNAVVQAVRLIERTQSDAGGWYYHPANDGNHEGSITICMLQALRAAHNAGLFVKKRVIDKAVKYIEESAQKRNGKLTGAFKYSLVDNQTSFALTAAAVSTLHMCGQYDSNLVRLGLSHMDRELDDHLTQGDFYYYGVLYASQAYFQVAGRPWRKNFPRIRNSILKNAIQPGERDEDYASHIGAFKPHIPSQELDYGVVYATAMATLTLQIPYRFLPVFQK